MTVREPLPNEDAIMEDATALESQEKEESPISPETTEATEPTTTERTPEQEWPNVFYCPELRKLMSDPVVGPTGESYERSAVIPEDPGTDEESSSDYYPNRALKTIIEESVALRDSYFRSSMRSIQQSLSQGLVHLLPESTATEKMFRPLNDAYYCPITFNLMHVPVTDPEGNTFEKVAIENWIRVNGSSPITRTTLSVDQLYPNNAIHILLDEEKKKPVDQMHPSIRKWKEEPAPQPTDVEFGGAVGMTNTLPPTFSPPLPALEERHRVDSRRRQFFRSLGTILAIGSLIGFVLYGDLYFMNMFIMALMIVGSNRR